MVNEFDNLQRVGDIIANHGREMVFALVILILGLYLAKLLTKYLRNGLMRVTENLSLISIIGNSFYILFILSIIMATTAQAGFRLQLIFRSLVIVALTAIGFLVLFRPYIPSLPFKVGNVIKVGKWLGRVETITFLNTRMKTFEGQTVFIPNRLILNDIVVNYHFTATRRVRVDVRLRYDQDILKAKRKLEEIMINDPRVKKTPRPVVYTINLDDSWVKLGGRAWVDNAKYWITRCDLNEKLKYLFDEEKIKIAFPQLDVHHYEHPDIMSLSEEEWEA